MDRAKLAERIPMPGILILIPVGALVLLAYGVPDRNPPEKSLFATQAAITLTARGSAEPDCYVRPVHIGGRRMPTATQLVFKNETKGQVELFFPTNVFGTTHTATIPGTPPNQTIALTIHVNATPDTIHEYVVWSAKTGDFCEGKSHPGIIVK